MRILPVGERAVLLELEGIDAVHRMWEALRDRPAEGVEEVVPGARTLLLVLEEGRHPNEVTAYLPDPARPGRSGPPRTVTIPVVYDGPDVDEVAERTGLAAGDVGRLHSEAVYTVGFLGFSPGFAYLFGGDPRLDVPRLATPRTAVPPGSVALAGRMTAVYPQATPGGWRLIGRTDAVMFDPLRSEPALLRPGDRVHFERAGGVAPASASPLSWRPRPGPARAPGLEVVEPGALLTIQDRGRPGWGHIGVPVAGAADRGSAACANHLVGNPGGRAVLESTLGRFRLRLRADRAVAVTGARADVTVDGLPARQYAALPLRAGSELAVGPCRQGIRVYVAVAGGIDVEEVLGSRSTDTLSGLGPAPLAFGDLLPLGAPAGAEGSGPAPAAVAPPHRDAILEVRAHSGPRSGWLSRSGRMALRTGVFAVAGSSDRTGLRLVGPPVGLGHDGQVPSEGMVAGAVQVPPDGRPIVLMRNHPSTGGYPVVAVVDDQGVDALSQAAPGQKLRFLLSPTRTQASPTG